MASDTRIVCNPAQVFDFVRAQGLKIQLTAGMKGIGLEKDARLVAGVVYEGFTGHNIFMHVAAEPGGKWLTRGFLSAAFAYPFDQLGVDRVTGWVEASNERARRFDEHLGFTPEAVLKGAATDGGDVIIYTMWRKDCRYV